MMPNIDPRQLKRMMDSMGIKSTEIEAERVVIQAKDRDIVIEDPQITAIDAQGSRSFQISGTVREVGKIATAAEISDEDVKMVSEQSGVNDLERARKALEESGGDIAGAIIRLKGLFRLCTNRPSSWWSFRNATDISQALPNLSSS